MISQHNKHRIVVPTLLLCLLQEIPDTPVGILHDLCFWLFRRRLEPVGYDIRWMITDGEQGGHEGLLLFCCVVQFP